MKYVNLDFIDWDSWTARKIAIHLLIFGVVFVAMLVILPFMAIVILTCIVNMVGFPTH